jgi:hypothetical protein
LLSLFTLFLGAVGAALPVVHAHPAAALGVATGLLALVTVLAAAATHRPADCSGFGSVVAACGLEPHGVEGSAGVNA